MPHSDINFSFLYSGNQFFFCLLMAISIFLSPHGDNRIFFLGLIVACSPCSSSFMLNGVCTIFLWPDCRLLPIFELLQAERPLHNILLALRPGPLLAISIYYSPHGDNRFFLLPTRQFAPHGDVDFFFASRR
jgi:hypothetical protein